MRRVMSMNNQEEKTLAVAFKEFMRIKQLNNISPATVRFYNDSFRYFTEYIDENMDCSELNANLILEYIEYLKSAKEGISNISINSYLRGVRAIVYFCMEQGYTSKFKISLIYAEKPLKETYTDLELEKLLKKPEIKKCSFAEYRNWVIVCYLLGTGNRRATVCSIKIEDLDFESHDVQLKKVKNKKQYTIPLSKFLEKTLQEYLIYRKGNPDEYLFCSVYGQKLTEDGLNTCIEKHNKSRGVLKCGIHLFRHTFAKKWILNRGDPFRLKAILGHSTMAMVNEYVNMFGKDLQKDFD
ncbi:MAG: tyrosine-type recombinase/integrase, partial [Oscillospiraceae bacterium]|nr:tyrosine-type recombinase/integrase [Oscillospiraceae bacterium]